MTPANSIGGEQPAPTAKLGSSLLRLAGIFLLLTVVAPLSSIHRAISIWYQKQSDAEEVINDDPVRGVGTGSTSSGSAKKKRKSSKPGSPSRESRGSDGDDEAEESVTNIGHFIVNGKDVSMDELLTAMLGMGFAGGDGGVGLLYHQSPYLTAVGGDEYTLGFQVILPWVLALILGVLVPAILTIVGHVRSRRFRNYYRGLDRKEKRLFRLVLCLKRFKKTIEEADIIKATTTNNGMEETADNNDDDDNDSPDTLLLVPLPGEPLLTKDELEDDKFIPHRRVPASCAICLDPYRIGDIAVWSSNKECRDVFHEQCIVSWLTKKRNARCPCCRQQFIDQVLRNQAGFR